MNRLLRDSFHKALLSKSAKDYWRSYLHLRHIDTETIKTFGLGSYTSKGFSARELKKADLVTSSDYHKFEKRLVIPLVNESNIIVGFAGRAREESLSPKYINSSTSEIFSKKDFLYGLDLAKRSLLEKGEVIVVEGYFATLLNHQRGFNNTVACCGSSIINKQAELLSRYTSRVRICLDGDEPGIAGTLKSIGACIASDLDVSIIPLPKGLDVNNVYERDRNLHKKLMIGECDLSPSNFLKHCKLSDKNKLQTVVQWIKMCNNEYKLNSLIKVATKFSFVKNNSIEFLKLLKSPSVL